MRKLFTNLTFWVLIAITAGIIVGHYAPGIALKQILNQPWETRFLGQELSIKTTLSEFLSGFFISIVKLFINPIIFLTVTSGIINMGNLKKAGRVGLKSLIYFEVVTTFALVIGVAIALLIRPGHGVVPHDVQSGDISKFTQAGGFNWWSFFLHNSTLQVLIASLILGIIFNNTPERNRIIILLQKISGIVFKGLYIVMWLAPLGAFGGMAFTISKYGLHTLLPLAKLMITVYTTMVVFIFGALG